MIISAKIFIRRLILINFVGVLITLSKHKKETIQFYFLELYLILARALNSRYHSGGGHYTSPLALDRKPPPKFVNVFHTFTIENNILGI